MLHLMSLYVQNRARRRRGCANFTVSDSWTCSLTAQPGPTRAPSPPSRGKVGFWGGQAAGTEGRRMIPSLGGDPFPSLLKARCWEMERNQGPSSWLWGRTTALWRVRKLRSGPQKSWLGGPKNHSPSGGPCILIYKTRLGPLEETFLPKAVVLGHAQLWQDDLIPQDVNRRYSMPQRGVKSGRSEL